MTRLGPYGEPFFQLATKTAMPPPPVFKVNPGLRPRSSKASVAVLLGKLDETPFRHLRSFLMSAARARGRAPPTE